MTRKNLTFIGTALIILVLIAFGILMFIQKKQLNLDERYHKELYAESVKLFESQLETSHFREQIIVGETRGSSSRIRLTWQKPVKPYNHFVIVISDPKTGKTRRESGEHERMSLDVSDLKADTEYVFTLLACLEPSCKKWMTSREEPRAKTEKMYWQLFDTIVIEKDVALFQPVESWQTLIDPQAIVWLNTDGTLLDRETAEQIQLEQLYYRQKNFFQVLLSLLINGQEQNAELLNP